MAVDAFFVSGLPAGGFASVDGAPSVDDFDDGGDEVADDPEPLPDRESVL